MRMGENGGDDGGRREMGKTGKREDQEDGTWETGIIGDWRPDSSLGLRP